MQKQKALPGDSIIRAGLTVIIAMGIFNVFNFLYHFFAARMLGPEEYSIVASLFSIVYLVGIGSTTIQNTVTKFVADFKSKNEKLLAFLEKGNKKLMQVSLMGLALFLLISPAIAKFLKTPLLPVVLISPVIVLMVLLPFNRGFLQGTQKFGMFSASMIIESILKLVLAVAAIYFGLKANGAIAAVPVALFIALLATFPVMPDFKSSKTGKKEAIKIDKKEIYTFSIISLLALFLVTALYSVDIFLVKHFLPAVDAGQYGALSLMGKVLFYGSTAIGIVMFPKIVEMKREKKKTGGVFRKAILFTLFVALAMLAVYFLFSDLLVKIVFGSEYAGIAGLLGLFGLFMTFVSLAYICVLKKLAFGEKKFILILIAAVITEAILISFMHNTLKEVVISLNIIAILLFLSLLK